MTSSSEDGVIEIRPAGKPARRIPRRRRRRPLPAAILAEASLPVFDLPMRVLILGLRRQRGSCTEEVVALVHETPGSEDEIPLIRVHSACLTGDVFGSLKCDCGPQLKAALQDITKSPRGALLYMLTHEGRGIGLASKIRAYHLQDEGLDTIAANVALGLPVDARDYAPAAAVLMRLGMTEIDLLTNNPAKIESLLDYGVTIRNRVPISGYVTPQNAGYLEVKDTRMGHLDSAEPVDESKVSPVVPLDEPDNVLPFDKEA